MNSLLVILFLNVIELICLHTSITIVFIQLYGLNYCNQTIIIRFNINNLVEDS